MCPNGNGDQLSLLVPSDSGGPGVFRGTNYQLDWTVYHLLNLISKSTTSPLNLIRVTVENSSMTDTAGAWDLKVHPPDSFIEVKFAPNKKDILTWLAIASSSLQPDENQLFVLVYNEAAATLIRALSKLQRLAAQAPSPTVFNQVLSSKEPTTSLIDAMGGLRLPPTPTAEVAARPGHPHS
jgi:hypothetical protein